MTKILVIGSILKEFPKAVAKINSINAKHGPFEFCLVAGHVKVENIENVSLNLTTYVVGDCLPMENLVALGSHGILSTAAGITIGYAGFQENMELEGKTVDILLTNEWPLGIFNNSATNPMQVDSSLRIAEIAANLMPRYHFASTNNVFWEREPYKNQNNTFTRFIAIADFNNDKKQRWFYAMNFGPKKAEPTATESPYAISIKRPRSPDNGTGYFWNESAKDQMIKIKKPVLVDGKCNLCKKSKCPHTLKKQIPDGYICRICGIPGHHIYDCPHGHTAGPSKKQKGIKCWFCLSNPDVASHLIVTVLDDVYVALAKGGLNEGHLLVVPVNLANKVTHLASTRQLELVESSEGKKTSMGIQKDLKRVEDLVAKIEYEKGNSLVCFEVFIGGDQTDKNVRLHHLHFQLVPLESDLEDLIESQFKEEVKHHGFVELESLPESTYWPYCKLWIHGRKPIIIAPPQSSNGISIPFNIQIARYSLASLIGKPELVDWKKCVLTLEEETELTEKYRKILVFE